MQNKIKALTNLVQVLMNENTHLQQLSVGTLETIKLMPGYDEAIKSLQDKVESKKQELDGVIEQDTK